MYETITMYIVVCVWMHVGMKERGEIYKYICSICVESMHHIPVPVCNLATPFSSTPVASHLYTIHSALWFLVLPYSCPLHGTELVLLNMYCIVYETFVCHESSVLPVVA